MKSNTAKKLLFITTVPETIFFGLEEQIPYLLKQGYDVSAVCSKGSWITISDINVKYGIKAYQVGFKRIISPIHDFLSLLHITALMFFLRPDIIHASTPKAALLSIIGASITRIPLRIYHNRGIVYQDYKSIAKIFWHSIEKTLCFLSHIVIVNSASNRRYLQKYNLCPIAKLHMLGSGSSHGIDYVKFNPSNVTISEKENLKQSLNIPKDKVVYGFVGRIVKDKGIMDLAEAWKTLLKKNIDAHLILVGPITEPRDNIPSDCLKYLNTTPTIHFCSDAKNARKYYPIFNVFVHPSYREGFPNVVLEAGAMEIPVITTDALGCIDSVVDGVTGLIYKTGDCKALANLMFKLYVDPVLRKKLGKQAREHIIQYYDPMILCKSLSSLIDNYGNEHQSARIQQKNGAK